MIQRSYSRAHVQPHVCTLIRLAALFFSAKLKVISPHTHEKTPQRNQQNPLPEPRALLRTCTIPLAANTEG